MQGMNTNGQKTTRRLGLRTARAVGVLAAVAAAMAGPIGFASSAQAAPAIGAVAQQRVLPPGVVKLNDGEPCPTMSLCLYRDYFSGPSYAIAEGYEVNLHDLPCDACAFGPSMAENVSSWINLTTWTAVLTEGDGRWTPLPSDNSLIGGPSEDRVVKVTWQPSA